jgi:hypothetical protein
MLTTQELTLIVVGILIVLAVVALLASRGSRTRHERLRRRFGPEYDRAVQQYGSVPKAERALMDRANRIGRMRIHGLNQADRGRFAESWRTVQARFVDDPTGAVVEANDLIKSVMGARGYPVEDFEQRVADLSVEHANVVQHYRAARGIAETHREGRANTEDLRQAFVHYRALFADLLEEPSLEKHELHEVRA